MLNDSTSHKDRFRGVFSSQEIRKVGTGTTTKKTVQKTFWFAEEDDDGHIMLQPVNSNYIPSGSKKIISRDELIENYSPEPEFYVQSVFPKMKELTETIDSADSLRNKNETFSAEYEYNNALSIDEDNVRANFGIGLTYLTRGETDKANNIFERLINLDAAFEEEHKHLFNDFGISLRKQKMYKQAADYYTRCLELAKEDENVHINLARALLDGKEYDRCVEHLLKALDLCPGNEIAMKFLDWVQAKKLITDETKSKITEYFANNSEINSLK